MPRNPNKNTKYDLDIYVILSEISAEFIVWKIKSGNTYAAYKDHARLKSSYTKELFSRSIEQRNMPKMYLLETVNCSQREAMKHCIVWTKYFMERGYTPLAGDVMISYTETLDEKSLALYNVIKDKSIKEIINSETVIVENYQTKSKKNSSEQQTETEGGSKRINLTVNQNQYQIIKRKAEYVHMPVAKYCKLIAVDGFIFRFDFTDYIEEIRSIKRVIREIQEAIYQNGQYYPADLENLQKCLDEVDETQMKIFDRIYNVVKRQAGKMPKELYEKYKD